MKEGRPILEMERPFFREFLVSLIVSFLIVGALFGILAIISISLVTAFQIVEPSELVVEYSKEREKLEKVEAVSKNHEFSPSVSEAPVSFVPLEQQLLRSPKAIPAPELEEIPLMDDLDWSDKTFEPWDEEKKPEVKPEPQVVRKPPSKGNPSSAKVVFRSSPVYPSLARRSGIEGKVIVLVVVTPSGRVSNARVGSSSGNGLLDAAALKAARLYRFIPAKNVAGQGVSTKTAIPFIFRLK